MGLRAGIDPARMHEHDQDAEEERFLRVTDPYGFEHPFIRWLGKTRQGISMALTIMLAMAWDGFGADQPEHLRSLL